MSLILYNPLREMDSFQRQMNQLFDEVFVPTERHGFSPKAELTETEEAYLLKLELPGISPDDLDIQATKDAVTISGDRQDTHSTEKDGVRRTEFRYGSFHRVIPVPGAIQNTEVTANYDAGILTLTLPKVEEAKNKVVKVQLSQ
ncbi:MULTISPECIES: Hsp20/alpha crystallin family protein [unclassified Synechocystis]|uniref:Hsp20/alpha crystallin family protein n=1 Tax=unclassified Synechocystis TaxID=2640012 RepID=UPI0003FA0B2C|nr:MULTISPECIES: Hsp20/alpha crystallin family protein [unclassified Synechocystis]AIE75260.1 Small heat shock protein [Synechocystis sp. PCC 6714]MCT0253003.1 Hsp20/alpha crystallin family protein [Synechocystis sp. CS-94]